MSKMIEWDESGSEVASVLSVPREEIFDKVYFNGGAKWGGYAFDIGGAYRDFPVHWMTFQHVLARKPSSVIEIGAGRGYIVKRLQDVGILAEGLEISRHCQMTRACEGIHLQDLCCTPWNVLQNKRYSLLYSVATLEHIPEQFLPSVIKEMTKVAERGLHGIDFGENDSGFDKTHVSLHDKSWWIKMFRQYAPGWPVEIVDKEELEKGVFPASVSQGDGKIKLNVGSFTTQFYHGWTNLDIHDLGQWSQQYGYNYLRCDVRQGLPYKTGEVDAIFCCHMLEHLTRDEGLSFLRECRRVIAPGGVMRILVPDTYKLIGCYCQSNPIDSCQDTPGMRFPFLSIFDEINDGCENSPTDAGKLWELLFSGHQSLYDQTTLEYVLEESGFESRLTKFRHTECGELGKQILRETIDMQPELSLIVEAVPVIV